MFEECWFYVGFFVFGIPVMTVSIMYWRDVIIKLFDL